MYLAYVVCRTRFSCGSIKTRFSSSVFCGCRFVLFVVFALFPFLGDRFIQASFLIQKVFVWMVLFFCILGIVLFVFF